MISEINNTSDGTILKLNGAWNYELDAQDKGLKEEWFHRKLDNTGFILPGTTAANHVGEALEMKPELNKEAVRCLRQKYKYVGAAWYQKTVELSKDWSGKEVFLFLERVMFGSTLWINGQEVGSKDSLSVPHIYNITEYILDPKECVITLRIDNRDIQNIGPNPSAYTDETQTIWNGAVGKVELFVRDRIYLENVQLYPQLSAKSIQVKAVIKNHTTKQVYAKLDVKVYDKAGKNVYCNLLSELNYRLDEETTSIEFTCRLAEEILEWDEFSPELYNLELSLEGSTGGSAGVSAAGCAAVSAGGSTGGSAEGNTGEVTYHDSMTVSFGMREFKTEGSQFVINHKKIFLRGTLDCCIFPLTGFPPTEKASWLEIFTTVKNYGLNHVRFHSWCPPEAAFAAADELGVYLSVEAPMWMDTWTGYAVGSYPEHYSYLPAEAKRILETYGNHPSFCMFSNGNELNGDFTLLHDMIVSLKKTDSRRVYTLTTNWDRPADSADDFFVAQTVDGVGVRGQFYLDQLAEGTNLEYNNAVKLRSMPIVAHEVGQYAVYPDINEIPQYSGVLKPINFEVIQNDLTDKGMLKHAKDFSRDSGKLALMLYKDEIEAALRTEGFGGFQLLGLQDFPGQSTATIGIINSFWKSKGLISESGFREFCSPVVPLLRMDKRIYSNGEQFHGQIQISNFESNDLDDLTIHWEIKFTQGETYAKGQFNGVTLPQGTLISIGEIKALDLRAIDRASQLTLTISIDGMDVRNQWQLWVYPAKEDDAKTDTSEKKDIIIASVFDESVEGYLQQGKKVLLVPEESSVKEVYQGKFFPVFWSPVHFVSKDPCGMVCKKEHPVFQDFPTDPFAGYQWKKLLENSFTMCIDSLPVDFETIVQIIPNFFNNHRMTNLFETKVGSGKLMICSIDLSKAGIEGKQLLQSILNYMSSEQFSPGQELEPEVLKRLFQ